MAVINVKEDWSELGGDFGTERASTTRKFTVLFDTEDAPQNRPFLALNANDGTTRIPNNWEQHSNSPWLFVTNKIPRASGPFLFEVMVYYSTIPFYGRETSYDPTLPPLDQPAQIGWSFARYEAPVDIDRNGNLIRNAANESYSITQPAVDLVLHYSRNRANYNPIVAAAYMHSVNNDTFLVFPPGMAKCQNYSGTGVRSGDLFYWKVDYEFQFRFGPWLVDFNDYARWKLVLKNEGFRYWNATRGRYENILLFDKEEGYPGVGEPGYNDEPKGKNSEGVRIAEPWPLKPDGNVLSETEINNGVMYLKVFETLDPMPYSTLDIS